MKVGTASHSRGQPSPLSTQVLITLCAAVAAVSAAPRYLVIPIEDVDMSMFSGQTLPVYRVPGLARTARMAQEEDSYQSAPAPYDSQVSGADRNAMQAMIDSAWNREYIICERCLKL